MRLKMRDRRKWSLLITAAGGLFTANGVHAQVAVTLSASQTVGTLFTAPFTIDATANAVDITQTSGTAVELFDGTFNKIGLFSASISGGRITSDAGEIFLNGSGGDLTINSAITGASLALDKNGAGRVILGSTNASLHNFSG